MTEIYKKDYPNSDAQKLTEDLAKFLEKQQDNHPALVGAVLIRLGARVMLKCAPSSQTGFACIEAAVIDTVNTLKKEEEKKTS